MNSQAVKVQNCSFNYLGRDGPMILEDRDKIPVRGISFSNCTFNYNGRNGFSWCGGEEVRFYKCFF
ncbi:hypothetical protein EGI32_02820 [Ferruginibacter sp. HRS2-29]|nr:hypothetical protein [Ferruginibacter sp. HRS2-29]